jgi:predicted RNA-binding protein with PIN domain
VPHDARPGPPNLRHDHLRSALDFAVSTAASWQKQRPPRAVPAAVKSFVKPQQQRLPASQLGRVRRVIDADDEFRAEVATLARPGQVDDIGIEWLRREPGWEQRLGQLVERHEQAAVDREVERELARERRRRAAAEERAERADLDVSLLGKRLADVEKEADRYRRQQSAESEEIAELRNTIGELRKQVRDASQRAESLQRRVERIESEREETLRRARNAELQRDAVLATRAELSASDGVAQIARLRDLAASARTLADRLGMLVAAEPPRRRAVEVPRPEAKDPRRAAEFLLRVSGIVVIVDAYNVAKLAWPDASLENQRSCLLDAVDGLARRFGTEFVVVIDGADVVGAHANKRRLARVRYSSSGVTADDVIRDEIAALDPRRAAAVVSNDGEVRRDVIAAGANVISSETIVAVALG